MQNKWENVGIDHELVTPKTGTHTCGPETKTSTFATTKISWDEIVLKSSEIEVKGYFSMHPYSSPLILENLVLNLDENSKTNNHRKYKYYHKQHAQSFWAYQEAKITLEFIVEYNEEEKIVAMSLSSTIEVHTEGSVHECYCRSNINTLIFIQDGIIGNAK